MADPPTAVASGSSLAGILYATLFGMQIINAADAQKKLA
jgi:hypothetical protein